MAIIDVIPIGARTNSSVGGVGATTALVDRKLGDALGAGTVVYGAHPDGVAQHYGMHINAISSWTGVIPGLAALPAKIGLSFRVWIITNAATAATTIAGIQTTAGGFLAVRQNTSGTHDLEVNIPGIATPVSILANPVAATAYWIDLLVDVSGTTFLVDSWVNGVKSTQASLAGQTATTAAQFRAGDTNASGTMDFWVSDVIAYDYVLNSPLGPHYVISLLPTACGTHVETAGDFIDNTAANVVAGETTSFGLVDEWPANNTDYVQQNVTRSTSYLEYVFQSLPAAVSGHTPKYVTLYGAIFPVGSALANAVALRLNDTLNASVSAEAAVDCSIASNTLEYHRHGYRTSPGGNPWTANAVNALRTRYGFSSDASPPPALSAVGADVVVEANSTSLPLPRRSSPNRNPLLRR